MTWDGIEKRQGYIKMEERLREVELQLAKLNGSLPHLEESLKSTTEKIIEHEQNATNRWKEHLDCMILRKKATDSIKLIWVIISIILTAIVGFGFKGLIK